MEPRAGVGSRPGLHGFGQVLEASAAQNPTEPLSYV